MQCNVFDSVENVYFKNWWPNQSQKNPSNQDRESIIDLTNWLRSYNGLLPESASVQHKILIISTNHKTALKCWLVSCFVIGWNNFRKFSLPFWQIFFQKKAIMLKLERNWGENIFIFEYLCTKTPYPEIH